MVDINLHEVAEKEIKIKKTSSIFKSSSFISFGLLAVVLILYGGTKLYQMTLEGEKANLDETKKMELASVDKDAANELIDFQERVNATESNLNNKDNPKDTLDSIEKLMVKGVFLNRLARNIDDGKMEMEAVSDSFKVAASQMLSLKKSAMFDEVRIIDSGRDDSGRVVFSLEADLKNNLK